MGTVPLLKCQCWGISVACKAHLRFGDSPSPYDQCWGIPWEPRFFEAPALLLTTLERVVSVFIEIKVPFPQCGLASSQVKGTWALPKRVGMESLGPGCPDTWIGVGTPLVFPSSQCPFCVGS